MEVNGTGFLIAATGGAVSALGDAFEQDSGGTTSTLTDGFQVAALIKDIRPGASVPLDPSGDIYVPVGGGIQRGIDSAAPGAKVRVQAGGSYAGYSPDTKLISIAYQDGPTLTQQADALDPTRRTPVVVGTVGDDRIVFVPGPSGGRIDAAVGGLPWGTFAPTGRLAVQKGTATTTSKSPAPSPLTPGSTAMPATTGSRGGVGSNLILGGGGEDLLVGGPGRDILLGGAGSARIVGNAGDDILISGNTAVDAADAALAAILPEWTSTRTSAARVANLKRTGTGPRANGNPFLITDRPGANVFDAGAIDTLTGSAGLDWFLFNFDGDADPKKRDKATDLSASEFASDLDFINGR